MASVVGRTTQCGDPGRGDCWALHPLGDPFVIARDDGYSQYLSGILGVESIGGAAFDCPCFVLAEATGEALAAGGEFLRNGVVGHGFCDRKDTKGGPERTLLLCRVHWKPPARK